MSQFSLKLTYWLQDKNVQPREIVSTEKREHFQDKQIIETIFGLNYNKDCWVFSFTYHKLASAFKDFNNAFFLELKLKGLTNIGPDPTDVIERNFRR